jgi:hypothetical protein
MRAVTEQRRGFAVRRSAILCGAAVCTLFTGTAFAQEAAQSSDASKGRHRLHEAVITSSERLDLLERQVEQQAQQVKQQAEEIEALKAQLNQGSSGSSEVSPAQFEALQNQVYETQAAVKAASVSKEPKDKKIHVKGLTITLNGFAAAETVWRSANEESDIGSSYSKIPFPGPGPATSGNVNGNAVNIGHTGEFRMSARQSRISGLVEGDADPDTHLAFYGEFDFLGAAASANSNESNSYTPRIRALYGTVDWSDLGIKFLYGQNWSLVTLDGHGISERSELPPPSIDAQYVPGFDWTRQPQLRLVKNFGDELWVGVSVENPQTTVGGTAPSGLYDLSYNNGTGFTTGGSYTTTPNGTADAEFNPGISLSLNHVPDLVGKVAWEPAMFDGDVHLEVFGLYRDFYDRYGNASAPMPASTVANHDVSGGGGGFGALVKIVPGLLDLQADGMFGSGIGRYGSGQLPDATFDANGNLKPISEDMEMAGLTLHATHALDIYVFGGREHEDAGYFQSPNAGGIGNPTVNDTGCQNFNLTTGSCAAGSNLQDVEQITVGAWDSAYDGEFGKFKIGLQYSYTYLKAFPGVINSAVSPSTLGSPHTNDNMVFTSFRYYPF